MPEKPSFAEQSLGGTYFYDINRGDLPPVDLKTELSNMDMKPVAPLKFNVNTDDYGHMARAVDAAGRTCKVRACFDEADASRITANVDFAVQNDVPTPRTLERRGRFAVMEYVDGAPISEPDLDSLARLGAIHHKMHVPFPELADDVNDMLRGLTEKSIEQIRQRTPKDVGRKIELMVDRLYPDEIHPVFDHQDVGVHNAIADPDGGLWVIDEEAFGILPLGFTTERALYGPPETATCQTLQEREAYMYNFPDTVVDYYRNTQGFWRLVHALRSAGRMMHNGRINEVPAAIDKVVKLAVNREQIY